MIGGLISLYSSFGLSVGRLVCYNIFNRQGSYTYVEVHNQEGFLEFSVNHIHD